MMSGTQQFILALLAILMPIITVLLTFILTKLNKVAKAVNGLQDKLVADTRVIARMEGAQMEAAKQADPEADGHLTIHEAKP